MGVIELACLRSGATWDSGSRTRPGCSKTFCSPSSAGGGGGWTFNGYNGYNGKCGFSGSTPSRAWAPQDMQTLLQLHKDHGVPWKAPSFHSGYNEVVCNSHNHNDRLPHSVSAFFHPRGHTAESKVDGITYNVAQAHRDFLSRYGLTAAQVPLLSFDPSDWDAPFAISDASLR